ncbi:MAG: LPXTG-motif cell wall anchor domain protein [Herbinix sp.]|jgi:LPXTG-motif cell wall-anchored protein|nr:LPXTG-motif cell wall anchor domain protein [Herbinix sp.]
MKGFKLRKVFTTMVAFVCLMMLMSANVLAATTEIIKDGEFQNAGFINAGEVVDGIIQGPGNWTQLNCGDAAVEVPYLHIIVKATGDTAAAQIAVSDTYTFTLADLGITLTEEYQDVVLPVQENGITLLSWVNLMGLDGGTSVYTVKDVFLSDDAASSLAPAVTEDTTAKSPEEAAEVPAEATAETEVPKTGSSDTLAIISFVALLGSAAAVILLKNKKVQA